MNSLRRHEVPDGGWGWVVVGAVALINMTNLSISSVSGLLFGNVFGTKSFTLFLMSNLNSFALNMTGFFIGPIIKNFKPRNVAAVGCLMVSFGLALCAFSFEDWHFIIGYSLFIGFGLGLINPSTFIAINSYFDSKKGRAVGISLAGAGVGQIILPHVVTQLLKLYGFRIAVLIMSFCSLTGVFGALLLKPLSSPEEMFNNRKHVRLLSESNKSDNGVVIKIVNSELVESEKNVTTYKLPKIETESSMISKIFKNISQAMDLELLKDPIFLSIIFGIAVVYTSTINFTTIYPNFLKHTVGLSEDSTAMCMSIAAGADIICRLLFPCITDKLKVPYRVIFLFGSIGLLLSRSALAEATDFHTIVIIMILTGIAKSATILNNNLTISGHCCPEKLPGALGLNMVSKGIIVLSIGQLFGWIRDYTQSYTLCLHAQNILLLIVVLLWTPELCFKYWKNKIMPMKVISETQEEFERNV